MIEGCPDFISILFGLTVVGGIYLFYRTVRSLRLLCLIVLWLVLQSVLGLTGVYRETESLPPRLMLFGLWPALVLILFPFFSSRGRAFIDRMDLKALTWFHSIRIPVEATLFLLYTQGLVSEYMTLEGTNYDLLSGLTAPLMAFLAFEGGKPNRRLLFWWNVICLLLLINVVITAILTIPTPFQLLSLEQPNVAVLYFPFNLLPSLLVPLVFMAHLVALRKLVKNGKLKPIGEFSCYITR